MTLPVSIQLCHLYVIMENVYHVTPVNTFDQPLWWKALAIIESKPEGSDFGEIVLRLEAFYTLMSFLGAIGYLMAGSGLLH